MNIIIVGCGKVGYTLVEQLSGENHNIVVVDSNPEKVQSIIGTLDAMGIVGDGVSYSVLEEAGITTADLLITVTGSDEQNLLCCLLAKKNSNCKTIARVRNPVYYDEIEYIKQECGLDMVINPEYAAANEIASLFMFPSAVNIETFAKGQVEILHAKLLAGSPLIGEKVMSIRSEIQCNVLVCGVTRKEIPIIPNGDFVFEENDTVAIVAKRPDAISFFRKLGLMKNKINNAILAGGGKISFYLSKMLIKAGVRTTIIEIDKERCDKLSEHIPEATIICANATEQTVLEEEGLPQIQGFAALTGLDEENILMSLYAKGVSDAKIVTIVNRINFRSVIKNLDIDTVVNPRFITANQIIKYVRSRNNSINSNVENLYKLEDGKIEALEFLINEESKITGKQLQSLKIKKNTLICSICRDNKIIIPSGKDSIKVNDSVIVVMSGYRISDIKEILED